MQAQIKNNFWIKIAITCVVLALIFNFMSIGLGFLFSALVGGFVDILLFVVLDVFVAAILIAVDALLFAVDIFVYLLLSGLEIAGYAAVIAVVVVPLALIYKYNQNKNLADNQSNDAEYK